VEITALASHDGDAEHNATLVSMVQVFADIRLTDEIVPMLAPRSARDKRSAG